MLRYSRRDAVEKFGTPAGTFSTASSVIKGTQMHEQEVKIQAGEIALTGTLCAPGTAGKFPAVLMVHGSGPLDRNENMKGQQLNIQ